MTPIWHQKPQPEELNRIHEGTACAATGINITAVGDDWLQGTMPVDERTRQPFGLLHGGAAVLLAETLASAAANACVDTSTHMCVGLDINANHVRAARSGHVTGTARPLHLGRSSQVWEIRIEDEQSRLVSIARMTASVVERR